MASCALNDFNARRGGQEPQRVPLQSLCVCVCVHAVQSTISNSPDSLSLSLSLSLSVCVCVFCVRVMCVGLCTSIKAAH